MSIPIHDQIQKLHACRDLYLKHDGKEHQRIETEMRLLGYHDFHRRIMYDRFERGRHHKGWIHHYGWHEELRNADCGVRIEEDAGTRRHGDAGKEEDAGTRRRRDAGILAKVGRVGRLNPDDTEDAADEVPASLRPAISASSSPASPRPSLSASSASSSVPDFEDFQTWLTHVSPSMTWDWKHQVHIYKHLKRVTDGESKRLMIFLPPRHGKSELVTVRYTAWRLKRDSKLNVIIGSYNQRLANRFSRKVRNVLIDAETRGRGDAEMEEKDAGTRRHRDAGTLTHTRRFKTSDHSETAEHETEVPASPRLALPASSSFRSRRIDSEAEWETPAGGGVRAVGAGAGVTGYGARLIVIDDPVKSRAEAESETLRERVWDWFNDDLYTRLEPGGAIILIQTRWHEDDLAGRLLRDMKEEGAEQWDVVNLPALAEGRVQSAGFSPYTTPDPTTDEAVDADAQEHDKSCTLNEDPLERKPGEALCPARYDKAALHRLKRRLGSYSFSALYQQRPVPASGGLFKRKWFKVIDRLPPDIRNKKRGWDLGISGKDTADFTASMGVAYDRENNMYIYDGFRRQIEYPEQRRVILGRIRAEPDTEHGIELSANGNAAVQDLRRERNLRGRPVRGVKVKGDKVSRALPWIALAEEGRVHLVRGPWVNDFLDEACSFPSGTHDDQIDAVSVAVQMHRERSNRLYVF